MFKVALRFRPPFLGRFVFFADLFCIFKIIVYRYCFCMFYLSFCILLSLFFVLVLVKTTAARATKATTTISPRGKLDAAFCTWTAAIFSRSRVAKKYTIEKTELHFTKLRRLSGKSTGTKQTAVFSAASAPSREN